MTVTDLLWASALHRKKGKGGSGCGGRGVVLEGRVEAEGTRGPGVRNRGEILRLDVIRSSI